MEKRDGRRPHSAKAGNERPAGVLLRRRECLLELRFGKHFTSGDLAAVRAIAGRRWDPDRRVWLLPDTPDSMAALRGAFGVRLTLDGPQVDEGVARQGSAAAPLPSASDAVAAVSGPAASTVPSTAPVNRPGPIEKILDDLRRILRTREYSPKTERAYLGWTRRFLRFNARSAEQRESPNGRHAGAFLEYLASRGRLSAKSRNQAASALAFMFKEIFGRDEMAEIPRARGPRRMPLVLSHREAVHLIGLLKGKYLLIASLLYSAGLRIDECMRLRIKDIDFELRQIMVRDGKGQKDRFVPLANRVRDQLRAHLMRVAEQHREDLARGQGWVQLPGALDRTEPGAGHDLAWQYVFPSSEITIDPVSGRPGRAALHATAVQRAVKKALRRSGIQKRASCHTFRHSFATEALRGGCDIRTLQHLMGHKDIRTTMIYLHVIEQTGFYVRSPLDRPDEDPSDLWRFDFLVPPPSRD